jgi:hypothetical protein
MQIRPICDPAHNFPVGRALHIESATCSVLFGCPAGVDLVAKDRRDRRECAATSYSYGPDFPRLRCNRPPAFVGAFLCWSVIRSIMSVPHSEIGVPPRCETCGMGTVRIGKLPRIGLRPLVHVYKCDACNQITSVEPERQEEAFRRRPAATRLPIT